MRDFLTFTPAVDSDAIAIANLRNAAAAKLDRQHGRGFWSRLTSEESVRRNLRTGTVLAAREGEAIVASFRLSKRKPWAIDRSYFSPARRPFYLTSMAVTPTRQGAGLGRRCLEFARQFALHAGADAIFLDAFDATAGAGGFYRRCGYREMGRTTFRRVPLIYYELLLSAPAKAG